MKVDPFNPYGKYNTDDPSKFSDIKELRQKNVSRALLYLRLAVDDVRHDYIRAIERRNALVRQMRDAGYPNKELARLLDVTETAVSRMYHSEEPVVPEETPSDDRNAKARAERLRVSERRFATLEARHAIRDAHIAAWLEVHKGKPSPHTLDEIAYAADLDELDAEELHRRTQERIARSQADQETWWTEQQERHVSSLVATLNDTEEVYA